MKMIDFVGTSPERTMPRSQPRADEKASWSLYAVATSAWRVSA